MKLFALANILALTAAPALAADPPADAARGARVFQQCMACHSLEPGRHMTGPSLAGVWQRKAGSAPGFLRYSDALRNSGLTWNEETLQRWLADPQALVPGNGMAFPGIRDARARSDLVAFLKASSEGKAPQPQQGSMGGGGMGGMMGGNEPTDLRGAGRESQVDWLRHCRDTYVVRTRDGKTHKIWEYNVRLKTDSSERGPRRGSPVITGSGMQGDRFSIVFAAPGEISPAIRESCE